ncbi:MAG: nucleoside phosphorylase [Clostridia bacterium]|nr:nucleoside phosphorylase [Clostridia bacterium]
MITESFDKESNAIINPKKYEKRVKCDICIVTFSSDIEKYLVKKLRAKKVAVSKWVGGEIPVYTFKYKNKIFGFYKTMLGASASAGTLEEIALMLDTEKFLFFGSAGSLDREISQNKVVVPTFSYRDEGTSYHYAEANDYIKINNSSIVADFMSRNSIPYIEGKIWTTDAFYRETKNNFSKRKSDGCIAVDMECSAIQSVCDFRGLDLFYFLICGDLLDAPEWDPAGLRFANHDIQNLELALKLALKVCT